MTSDPHPPPSLPGSYGAFQKVYEQPIVRSQQPETTPPEREVGEMRAKEVHCVYGCTIAIVTALYMHNHVCDMIR